MNKHMIASFRFPLWFLIVASIILLASIFIRAQDLGYSNFQGDEVQTMDFLYTMDDGVVNYLLAQKRGPTQYVINLINYGIFGYQDEFQIRFPYLLFGIAAFFSFFYLSKKIFDRESGLITTLLLAVNGLFIAFARITQYQSLMYLTIPIILVLFLKFLETRKMRDMIVCAGLTAFAILTHYDTISIFPFFFICYVAYVIRAPKNFAITRNRLKYALLFLLIVLLPLLLFYVPLYLHREFDAKTSGYLEGRLFGGGLMPRTQITTYLLSMYIPLPMLYLIYLLAVASQLFAVKDIDANAILQRFHIHLALRIQQSMYIGFILLNIAATVLSLYPLKPRSSTVLVFLSAFAIIGLVTASKKVSARFAGMSAWFFAAYFAYFFLIKDARTHVYVVLIPAFILAGYTLSRLFYLLKARLLQTAYLFVLSGILCLLVGLNWMMFVDKTPEYPWFNKTFLGREIFDLPHVRAKKIDGVFGFNNWRGWELIADDFRSGCLSGSYDSNEKNSVSYFYLRKDQLRGEKGQFFGSLADNFILIEGPHSWDYVADNERSFPGFRLVKIITSHGIPVTTLYTRYGYPTCYD